MRLTLALLCGLVVNASTRDSFGSNKVEFWSIVCEARQSGVAPHEHPSFPQRLSEAGLFRDVRRLLPASGMVAYEVNAPFWSDGAGKHRWIALPNRRDTATRITFRPTGEWTFPPGTLFVKHFEFPASNDSPPRRLETRVLLIDGERTFGVTYRWQGDSADAVLVRQADTEAIAGLEGQQPAFRNWYFPSPKDCLTCHTSAAGYALGVNTRQLNRDREAPDAEPRNQLHWWSQLGMFDRSISEPEVSELERLVAPDDTSQSLKSRSRSYLDANCAYCHRPGGAPTQLDLRFEVPLERQYLVNGPVRINLGIDRARALAPNDVWRSIVLARMKTLEPTTMPPFQQAIDHEGVDLLTRWVESMPGPSVTPPPRIAPPGGDFTTDVYVQLSHGDGETAIRYTLDGSVPHDGSPLYEGPIPLERSTTVRARAMREDSTDSITVQETYIINRNH